MIQLQNMNGYNINLNGIKPFILPKYIVMLVFISIGLFSHYEGVAQHFPPDNETLTYTQIRFAWPAIYQADTYILQVASTSEQLKKGQALLSFRVHDQSSYIVREGLHYGKKYYWQIIAFKDTEETYQSPIHSFSIKQVARADSTQFRHRIEKAYTGSDAPYFFVDKPAVLINAKGLPIWAFPNDTVERLFNLQLLDNGNIAYFRPRGRRQGNENLVFEERTLKGELVWRAPDDGQVSGDSIEHYHHDFQYLTNGNIMIAGNEFRNHQPKGARGPLLVRYGTLIEYNRKGEVVWSWKSFQHLKDEDVYEAGLKDNPVHLNGFHYNEATGYIYASFRYIDRIVKIAKQKGTIVHSFGRKQPSGEAHSANGFFHMQHSPHTIGSHLYLYDNATGKGEDTLSSLLIINMPDNINEQGDIHFRFPLNFGMRRESWSESKGDIDVLEDGSLVGCMGSIPRTVWVSPKDGLLWSCKHEFRKHPQEPWQDIQANYRDHWTYSLYPVQVAAQWELAPKGKRPQILRMQNIGTTTDYYRIILSNLDGKAIKEWQSDELSSNAIQRMKVKVKGDIEQLCLRVYSTQNPHIWIEVALPPVE